MSALKGLPPLVTVGGKVLAATQVVTPLTLRIGRADPGEQAEASACGFAILGELPEQVRLYQSVEVVLAHGEGGVWEDTWEDLWSEPWGRAPEDDPTESIPRFVGRITDLTPVADGGLLITQVTAVGMKAELGRIIVGGEPWAAESEDDRLQRLVDDVTQDGVDLGGEGSSWMLADRDQKRWTALEAIHHTAAAGALVFETATGQVVFEKWDARSSALSSLELSAGDVEDGVGWAQRVDRIVKQVVIRYGKPADTNSEQPEVKVGVRGRWQPSTTISTTLLEAADAELFGRLVLARWGSDTQWDAPVLRVPTTLLDDSTWDGIMGLGVSAVITTDGVTELPTPLPYGRAEWFVEGWVEEWDRLGNGPVWQTHQVALTARSRFRPDLGEPTQVVEGLVVPDTADYGTPRTVEARVVTADSSSSPVPSGLAVLMDLEGQELAGPQTPAGNGALAFTLDGDALQPGEHRVLVVYLGDPLLYLPSEAETESFLVDEPPGLVATVSLTASPSKVNLGDNVTLTASIGVTQGESHAGAVTFQVRRDGGAWSQVARVTVSKDQGKVSTKWGSTAPNQTTDFRAIYDPTLAGVATVTSAVKSVDVLAKTTRTRTYDSSWSQTYDGDGSKDNGADDLLFQGYVNSVHGNQKGLAGGFGIGSDWDGWSISKVEVYLFAAGWQNTSGTARIGSHEHSSEPGSSPKINAGRTTVKSWKRQQGKWVNVTSWGTGLARGNLKGIVFGPGSDRSAVYAGIVTGASSNAQRPKIRVTGYKWE